MKGITPEYENELTRRAENGSITAQSFFKACEMVEQAMDHLSRHQFTDAFKLYRLSQREWDLAIVEFGSFYSICLAAAKRTLDHNSNDADALYALVRIDMTQSNEEKLLMVKRCVELDPSVPDFHHLLASILGFVTDNKNGLRAVERAIEMLPNHPDWLYTRATLMRLAEDERGLKGKKYSADVAEAYLKFMSSNPIWTTANIPKLAIPLRTFTFCRAKYLKRKLIMKKDYRLKILKFVYRVSNRSNKTFH